MPTEHIIKALTKACQQLHMGRVTTDELVKVFVKIYNTEP